MYAQIPGMPKKLITLFMAVFLAGCNASSRAPAPNPLLVIGIDGFEWRIVIELLDEGKLPTLQEVMRRGTYGELESLVPTLSPALWTSIATGMRPRQHGIRGFVKTGRRGAQRTRLYNNRDRKTKAYWNILSERGRRVDVVGWWLTYPVEEINGVMAAQVNTTTLKQRQAGKGIWKGSMLPGLSEQVHPADREEELLALLPQAEQDALKLEAAIFGDIDEKEFPLAHRFKKLSHWALRADATYRRITLDLLEKEGSATDSVSVYFGGADVVAHRFWRYRYPELYEHPPSTEAVKRFAGVIADYYSHIDSVVGELIDAAPADTNVIILGDHGMHAVNRRGSYPTTARDRALVSAAHPDGPPSALIAAGPDIAVNTGTGRRVPDDREQISTLGSILDVAPTILALQNTPIGSDMAGDVMKGLVSADFLSRYPATYVATHTGEGWADARTAAGKGDFDPRERLEQLRSLGYVD